MPRKIIAMLLVCFLLMGLTDTKINAANVDNTDSIDITKCVLYAQQNTDAITINAGNLSINGDVVSGGNNTFTARSRNVNGTIYDNQEISMLRLMPNIEKKYLANSDYYNEDYVSENFNENINKSKYCACSFSCSNFLSVNNSAIMVGGDVTIKNSVTNMNNAILASIVGDIYIESNNFSVDGLIYAPLAMEEIPVQMHYHIQTLQ